MLFGETSPTAPAVDAGDRGDWSVVDGEYVQSITTVTWTTLHPEGAYEQD